MAASENERQDDANADPQRQEKTETREGSPGKPDSRTERSSTAASDPTRSADAAGSKETARRLDSTMVVGTDRIREPQPGSTPNFRIVPVVEKPAQQDVEHENTRKGNRKKHHGPQNAKRQKKGHGPGEENTAQGRSEQPKQDQQEDDQDREESDHGEGNARKQPSLMRILLFSGLVGLVCGVGGAWEYSYFFGSNQTSKSGEQSSSSKGSSSGKSSGSSKSSGSGSGSDSSSGSSSSSGSKSGSGSNPGSGSSSSRESVPQRQMAMSNPGTVKFSILAGFGNDRDDVQARLCRVEDASQEALENWQVAPVRHSILPGG